MTSIGFKVADLATVGMPAIEATDYLQLKKKKNCILDKGIGLPWRELVTFSLGK